MQGLGESALSAGRKQRSPGRSRRRSPGRTRPGSAGRLAASPQRSPARITPQRAMSPSRSQMEQKAVEVRATKMQLENEKLKAQLSAARAQQTARTPRSPQFSPDSRIPRTPPRRVVSREPHVVAITCPESLGAERRVAVELEDGRQVEVSVPEGVRPGQDFQVTLDPIPPRTPSPVKHSRRALPTPEAEGPGPEEAEPPPPQRHRHALPQPEEEDDDAQDEPDAGALESELSPLTKRQLRQRAGDAVRSTQPSPTTHACMLGLA